MVLSLLADHAPHGFVWTGGGSGVGISGGGSGSGSGDGFGSGVGDGGGGVPVTSTNRLKTTVPMSPVTHAVISTRPDPDGFHLGVGLSPGIGSLPGVAAQ